MGKTRRFNKENLLYEDGYAPYKFKKHTKKSKSKIDVVQERRKQKIKTFLEFDEEAR